MIQQLDVEVTAERFHAIVAGADPLASEFADQLRIFLEVIRKDAAADAWTRFQDGNVPILQRVGRG